MVHRPAKNIKHLLELIESATRVSLLQLTQLDAFACLGGMDPDISEEQARDVLRQRLSTCSQECIEIAEQEALRLFQLLDFRVEHLFQYAYSQLSALPEKQRTGFDRHADGMTQWIWLRVQTPTLFDRIETIALTQHFHGHKRFRGFIVHRGDHGPLNWTQDIEAQLRLSIGEIMQLDAQQRDACQIEYFQWDESGAEQSRFLHYLVVYHPGKMKLLRQMQHRRRNILRFIPALEATLVYDPANNTVHVLCARASTAKRLAEQFMRTCLSKQCAQQPMHTLSYRLERFLTPIDWMQVKLAGAVIVDAWLAALTVSLGHTCHRLTIQMRSKEDLWQVCAETLGELSPLNGSLAVYEAQLAVSLRLDGEQRARALTLRLDAGGASNLHALADPRLRQCGEDLLTSLGILQRIALPPAGASRALLEAELKLLDMGRAQVDGFVIEKLGFCAETLVQQGLLTRKVPGQTITLPIDEPDGDWGFRQLPVQRTSKHTWAIDEITGERFDLMNGDLCRYAVNLSSLEERLEQLLNQQLINPPLLSEQAPYRLLGDYCLGDQRLPVVLVWRLWDSRHADRLDQRLRQAQCGLTIVLSTGKCPPRRFLGQGIVIPLHALMREGDGQIDLDLKRIEGEIGRHQRAALATLTPHVLRTDGRSALLVGPWSAPWILTKKDWIDVVEVLVKGWQCGQSRWTRPQLEARSGVAFRRLDELFRGAPEWKTYIRSADGNQRTRLWELNIGPRDLLADLPTHDGSDSHHLRTSTS